MINFLAELFKRGSRLNEISNENVNSDNLDENQDSVKDDEKNVKNKFNIKYGDIKYMPFTMTFVILLFSIIGLFLYSITGLIVIPIISMKTGVDPKVMFDISRSFVISYIWLIIMICRLFFVNKDKKNRSLKFPISIDFVIINFFNNHTLI